MHRVALAVILLTISSRAAAQDVALYNNTETQGARKAENIATYSQGRLSFGWNTILTTASRPQHVLSTRVQLNRSRTQVFYYVNSRDRQHQTEAKLNQLVAPATYLDVGGGSKGLFHAGLEYGFLRPFGFGAGYTRDRNHQELRGGIWKYWTGVDLFAGVKKANDRVLTVVSRPSEQGPAIRYSNVTGVKDSYRSHQLVFGAKSRPSYYGLNFVDSAYYIKDTKITGPDAMNIQNNPLRYILPPMAWVVRNFGAKLQYVSSSIGRVGEAELVKYVNDMDWIGLQYVTTNWRRGVIRINAGRTSDAVKGLAGLDYDMLRRRLAGHLQLLVRL